jgi:hypothetical protein
MCAVPGCEDHRNTSLTDHFGNGIAQGAVQVEVQNRNSKLRLARKRQSIVKPGNRPYDLGATVNNHILNQHADHRLILNDKDAMLALT